MKTDGQRDFVIGRAEYFEFKARAAEHAAATANAEAAALRAKLARVEVMEAAEAVHEVVRRLGELYGFAVPCDISAVDDKALTVRVLEQPC